MADKKLEDMPLDEMYPYLVAISKAITEARKALDRKGMTHRNLDMWLYLKKAQNEIDVIQSAIMHDKPVTVNGQRVDCYTVVCYELHSSAGDKYYGLKQFGHTHCERIAQEYTTIPVEEFLAFNYQIPSNATCKGCGKPILPDPQTDEEE